MTSIFDAAKYILEKQGPMSTMKLQKLCYYCQAWSLVWDDAPLFEEDFEAWVNGPVCPVLFKQTRGKFSVCADDEPGDSEKLTAEQKDTVDVVLEHYAPHDAQWLSQLTHMEAPWKTARGGLPDNANSSEVITKESMGMYYGGL